MESLNLICPEHRSSLKMDPHSEKYLCRAGCEFPIIQGIPRFVVEGGYWTSFGLQWNKFQKTQLDSYTRTHISRDRLTRIMGGSLDMLNGKRVLEAGCGAGRFTELMLQAGAQVFAVDITSAVEGNYANCGRYRDYFVCQADLMKLPFSRGEFDVVVCLGVIQHTPDPERTISKLCSYLKPGGLLVMDHYSREYEYTKSRSVLREFLLNRSDSFRMTFVWLLVSLLWPFHKMMWMLKWLPAGRKARSVFLRLSPVVDYHGAYPQLGHRLLFQWAVLDTHDTLTDAYKHLRSLEEIQLQLERCGMIDIQVIRGGNGIEARAMKPLDQRSGLTGT